MTNTRQTGTVAKWLNHRGLGFIAPTGKKSAVGDDYLVHHSHIKQGGGDKFKSLAVGTTVEFELAPDPKKAGKEIAVNVTGVGGGDCERRLRAGGGQSKSHHCHGKKEIVHQEPIAKPEDENTDGRGDAAAAGK